MKRQSHTPKKPTSQKLSTLESVSATDLLKALHTLESISIIQEQIDDDLNISFSQKDTFSHDAHKQKEPPVKPKTTSHLHSTTKSITPKNHSKQANNISVRKSKNPKQPTQLKEITQDAQNDSKMDFEFYMSKKQHSALGLAKNRSRSPRPFQTQQSKSQISKSFQKTLGSMTKKGKENMTPKNKTINYGHQKSISPLTERSVNFMDRGSVGIKDLRLKTQKNERELICYQKKHTKANSSMQLARDDHFNKTNSTVLTKQAKPSKFNQNQAPNPPYTNRKARPSNPLHNLSMLERNKEYLRQKNERLAKLCQQVEQKKRQQQKECTFKPKILNDNTHIKAKYNDLCASRELMQRGHKKCKQGKENANEQEWVMGETVNCSKSAKCNKHDTKKQSTMENDMNGSMGTEKSISLEDEKHVEIVKTKYKNSKFNILLDMIH